MELFHEIQKFKIVDFDTSNEKKKYLINYNDRQFEIGQHVLDFIKILKDSNSLSDVASRFSDFKGQKFQEKDIEQLLDKCISPIVNVAEIPRRNPFLYKKELLSAAKLSKHSNILKCLFHKPVAIGIVSVILLFDIFFFYLQDFQYKDLGCLSLYEIITILILYVFSSFVHEVGHASACKSYNISHGEMGFGLYLNFPVFYTNVTEIWKLPRKQRIVINAAGIYFQLIYTLPLIILSLLMPENLLLKHFILLLNLNFLITLNPFFKFDGYWMASDMLGVPNLRARTKEIFSFYHKKIFNCKNIKIPFLFTMKRREKIIMIVYSVIVNLFFAAYFVYFVPLIIYNFFTIFPGKFISLVKEISIGYYPSFQVIFSLFSQLFMFLFTLYMLYRMLRSIFIEISKK